MVDDLGNCQRLESFKGEISKMISPVKCNHCGKIYDLTTAKVNHRYADCDQFTTPCCGYQFADTRTWKSFPDYENLDKYKTLANGKN